MLFCHLKLQIPSLAGRQHHPSSVSWYSVHIYNGRVLLGVGGKVRQAAQCVPVAARGSCSHTQHRE